jgi:hypothetical protein
MIQSLQYPAKAVLCDIFCIFLISQRALTLRQVFADKFQRKTFKRNIFLFETIELFVKKRATLAFARPETDFWLLRLCWPPICL